MEPHRIEAKHTRFFQSRLSGLNEMLQQIQGAVALYCETHDLKGPWTLSEDGSRLIPPDEPKTVEMPDLKSAAGGAKE